MKMNWNNAEKFLDALGLEIKREHSSSFFGTAGVFVAGCLTGAALGLLFAPKPGVQLRQDVNEKIGSFRRTASRTEAEPARY